MARSSSRRPPPSIGRRHRILSGRAAPGWPLARCDASLYAARYQQDDQDDEDDAEAAARVVAPSAAVGPGRPRADQQDDQEDQQNQSHGGSVLISVVAFPQRRQ